MTDDFPALRPWLYALESVSGQAANGHGDPWQDRCWAVYRVRIGVATVVRGGQESVAGEGRMALAQPGHRLHCGADARVDRLVFSLHCGPDAGWGALPDEVQPDARAVFGQALPVIVAAPHRGPLAVLFMEADAGIHADPWLRSECALRLALWCLRYARAAREQDLAPLPGLPADIQAAERMMRHGIDRRITIADIAASLGCSVSTFTRRYTAIRGVSPGKRLQEMRLADACAVLRAKNWDLADVARLVGYSNVRSLHQAFQRTFGISPGQWRRQARRS